MDESKNLHAGHRERLIKKFIENPSAILDHELIEIMLFNVIPRKDTNEIAHALLRTFGSLEKIFSATQKELMAVNGVGEKTAYELLLSGQIYKRVYANSEKRSKDLEWISYGNAKSNLIELYKYEREEVLTLILLDNNKKEKTRLCFRDQETYKVRFNISEITNAFAIHKPKFVILAHNHPSLSCRPSETDDLTTAKISLLCELQGIVLLDHLIIAGNNTYSYAQDGALKNITDNYALDKLLQDIQTEKTSTEIRNE